MLIHKSSGKQLSIRVTIHTEKDIPERLPKSGKLVALHGALVPEVLTREEEFTLTLSGASYISLPFSSLVIFGIHVAP